MRLLQHRVSDPENCPYLPGRASTSETMLMTGVSAAQLERLLELGWRRFGPLYFRLDYTRQWVLNPNNSQISAVSNFNAGLATYVPF